MTSPKRIKKRKRFELIVDSGQRLGNSEIGRMSVPHITDRDWKRPVDDGTASCFGQIKKTSPIDECNCR
jgi:hypothetical protein